MFRIHKPLQFFSTIACFVLIFGLIAGTFPILNYINTRYVSQVPMAILAVGLILTAITLLTIGIILSSITIYHNMDFELRMLNFKSKK
jgi:hypothetical protein